MGPAGSARRRRVYVTWGVLCSAVAALAVLTGRRATATAAPAGPAVSAPGRLDPAFGRSGIVRTTFGPRASGGVRQLLVDRGGRIVAVGSVAADEEASASSGSPDRDVAVVRYLPSGALDRSFGDRGKVIHDVRGSDDVATDAAQLPDGRIVVVGAADSVRPADRQDLMLLRFLPDGRLDETFGAEGHVAADLSPATPDLDYGFGVAVQKDGRSIVVGQTSLTGTNRVAFAVARFLPNGSPDLAFATDGVLRYGKGTSRVGRAVLVRPDGRILVGGDDGSSSSGAFVVQLASNGTLDRAFGVAGFAEMPRGGVRALAADAETTLAFGGAEGRRSSAFILRLDRHGRIERSFGVNGRADVPVAEGLPVTGATSGLVQRDGKILVAGANGSDILVARVTRTGRPDRQFGGTGVVTVDIDGRLDFASGVALGRGGGIVAAGESSRGAYELTESVLVRLIGSGRAGTRYASMAAANLANGVSLRWQTTAETDVRGFVVYRSSSGVATSRKRLTAAPIRARQRPARYAFVDRDPPDYAPEYWLEELRRDGSRALFGPIIPPETPAAGG